MFLLEHSWEVSLFWSQQIANSYRCSFCLSEVSWLSEISHVLSFIPPQPNGLIALVFQDTATCAASGCTQMQSAAKRTRPLVLKRRSISWETVNVQTVQKCVAGCLYWSLKKKWGNELTGFRGQLTANLTEMLLRVATRGRASLSETFQHFSPVILKAPSVIMIRISVLCHDLTAVTRCRSIKNLT